MDEKYQNYLFLQRSLSQLRSGEQTTDDWEQLHVSFFFKLRKYFTNFNELNKDIRDETFRDQAYNTEKLAVYIENQYDRIGRIDYKLYQKFLENIHSLFQYFIPEEELSSLMDQTAI